MFTFIHSYFTEINKRLQYGNSYKNVEKCLRHISLTSCNTISPQGLYAHPLLISYLFRDITYHLDPVLSVSQPHGSGTNSLSAFAKPSHFLLLNAILRLTFFPVSLPHPLATHHPTRPDSLIDFGTI